MDNVQENQALIGQLEDEMTQFRQALRAIIDKVEAI